ncbi:MAG: NAD-binding protein [Gammaproteobacteria bacterium]
MQAGHWIQHLRRALRWLWPQVPLGLFLIAAGALNISAGAHTDIFSYVLPGGLAAGVPELSGQVSLSALGSGAQIILGAGLLLSGLGLFWKLRVAWIFAMLLLAITIGVNAGKGHFGGALIVPGIAFLLLAASRRHFACQTLLGGALISLIGIFAVFAYGTFGMFLLGNQFEPPIKSLITALYFSVETLSTVGYGDYHPVTLFAQGYVITLIVFGLSVFATAIFSVVGPALSGRLNRLLNPSGGHVVKKNHVIVVGASTLARNTAQELLRRNIPFVQVVGPGESPPLEDEAAVSGEVGNDETLRKAGVAHARMVVAANDNDGENAFTALAAKDIAPDVRVIAVASSREALHRLKLARADMVFAPTEVGSRLLANLVEGGELPEQFLDLFSGETGGTNKGE